MNSLPSNADASQIGDPSRDADALRDFSQRPASGDAVVSINHMEPSMPDSGNSDESGDRAMLEDMLSGAPNTLAALGNMPPDMAVRRLHEIHGYFHDCGNAGGITDPIKIIAKNGLYPGGICPFCERSSNEHPGPIADVDGILNFHKRPTLSGDQPCKPTVEHIGRHEGEHRSGPSQEVIQSVHAPMA